MKKKITLKKIKDEYGVDFGKCRDDKRLTTWLKEQGFYSLAKLLKKVENK